MLHQYYIFFLDFVLGASRVGRSDVGEKYLASQ